MPDEIRQRGTIFQFSETNIIVPDAIFPIQYFTTPELLDSSGSHALKVLPWTVLCTFRN